MILIKKGSENLKKKEID